MATEKTLAMRHLENLPVCNEFDSHSICILLCRRCWHRYDEHGKKPSPPQIAVKREGYWDVAVYPENC